MNMLRKLLNLILFGSVLTIYIIHPYYQPVPSLVYNIAWYSMGILGAWLSLKSIIK